MRQIKFRARAIVNNKHNGIKVGDFVYGCFIESGCDAPCIIFGDGEQIEHLQGAFSSALATS